MTKSDHSWLRHLDGWQAGALVVVIAASATLTALPRAVPPQQLPSPHIDYAGLRAVMQTDDVLAARAASDELDPAVRQVGRQLRLYNTAAATGRAVELATAKQRLSRAVVVALPFGDEPLLQLRAYQMTRFTDAALSWQRETPPTTEMLELGGDFIAAAQRSGWFDETGHLITSERQLRTLFKLRWNQVTGVTKPAFALTLDENRVRYDYLLRHPFIKHKVAALVRTPQGLAAARGKEQLAVIAALLRLDPGYHAPLARGVVLYRQGQYALAANHFRRQLEVRPDGPFTLYTQNYLKATLDAAASGR